MVPQPLVHASAAVLEFEAFRELLRGYTQSELGQTHIRELAPSCDREWVEREQQLAAEIREYLRVGGRFDFGGLTDATKLIQKSNIRGVALEIDEIRDILLLAERAAEWREIVIASAGDARDLGRRWKPCRRGSPTSETSCATSRTS